jgi:glycosyltransferase involved in cell wall biosynthesis
MRILHLATSLNGGAGIAARRIAESQLNLGIDAEIWSTKSGNGPLASFEKIIASNNLSKFRSKLITYFQYNVIQNSEYLMTPISTQTLNLNDLRLESFELINLHANYNFINLRALTEKFRYKPIVVTMHDERNFTGGCHYSLECSKFELSCAKCPQVRYAFNWLPEIILRNQIGGVEDSNNLNFVSPSSWLAKLARSSTMLNGKEISVIRNPVPSDFFPLLPTLPYDSSRLNIAFVSENLQNPYKGLDVLIEALRMIDKDKKVSLKLIGNGTIKLDLPSVKVEQKYCSSSKEVVSEIQKCDVLVVPSIQDNSPSVISESLMCGVSVIGAAVGGITEILQEFGMPTFERGNSAELAKLIQNFVPVNNVNLANKANKTFSYPIVATQYKKLYETIMGS